MGNQWEICIYKSDFKLKTSISFWHCMVPFESLLFISKIRKKQGQNRLAHAIHKESKEENNQIIIYNQIFECWSSKEIIISYITKLVEK
jgi:hypothetical protein